MTKAFYEDGDEGEDEEDTIMYNSTARSIYTFHTRHPMSTKIRA